MKSYLKIFILSVVFLSSHQSIGAIPAYPYPVTITQPDGSSITLRQHGDEFMNYVTTEDGYTVIKNKKGFYVYAQEGNGSLIPSNYTARDELQRSPTEKNFLNGISKYIHPPFTHISKEAANKAYTRNGLLQKDVDFDYSKFKGLIILVEFSDRKFEHEDAKDRFTAMVNQRNYTDNGSTGSVNDYFYDNSMGKFSPTFNVVGPVGINYRQTDARQTENAHQLAQAACIAADELVNYKDYDLNGDNQVDMIYFIFAGAGSNFAGNNTNYLWPHASSLPSNFTLDNVTFGRYACSVELNGLEGSHVQDGIGTIIHEFSHVLGLKDYYDTDYSSSGGESEHPNTWSVMASGSYFNKSKTPCGYSLYERYALGWAAPRIINEEGTYTLTALNSSNEGFRINTPIKEEFFLLENRQQSRWDEYLPGHGMLVFRVDSTNIDAWTSNKINIDPKHMYYEMLRAQKAVQGNYVIDTGGDPFPGTGNVTSLTNQSSPSISSWSGLQTEVILTDISESSEGVIQFKTQTDMLQTLTEDFEEMDVTSGNARNIQGKFSKWDFSKALVQAPGTDKANGTKSIGIYKGGEIKTTTPAENNIHSVSFQVWNPTNVTTTLRLYYSTNNGVSWVPATSSSGSVLMNIASGESQNVLFNIQSGQPTVYKINMTAGSSSVDDMNYIDDFTLKYKSDNPPQSIIYTKDNTEERLQVTLNGRHLTVISRINTNSNEPIVKLFTSNGTLIDSRKPINGLSEFDLPQKGLYILQQGKISRKVIY